MIRTIRTLAVCAAALSAHAAMAADQGDSAVPPVHATVIGLDGEALGMVTLQDTPTGVLVTTDIKGLPEGEHGFHFHEKGICQPAEKFATSGGHFAAGAAMHGLMVEGGPHGGDMPNQHVGADGVLETQILNTGVTLAPGPKSLEDADGSALVIHAGADDYKSQPSGAAGGRIACAVISAPK
ncbi:MULTISPECIES: superoxide dismutase family protein [Novosphingobium]|uniref:Superoxide dismutase, Cu-Zn family n=1 Tax=Novosphingobium mathurense TaxID=428990 RepID=A0A1U6IKP7_9SPHN|nr:MULTISPECIES: superoxide dismutase family protein [Novosphingobium]CDO39001.1 Superoxide dismutase (Cu-Zn) 2 [Novosphingobium sp. KN65.2]SLK08581.1 superoxide dismutase, Cu-Zn family [Novosphingobium mathurense]